MPRPRVVILGAGFGGLHAARALAREPVDVVVVDRRNHHLFQPLLYQVATAGLSGPDIAAPIRKVLRRQRNATVLLGDARAVDRAARKVLLADGEELAYDHLIVATGVTHDWFGHEEWAEHAPGLKTLEDAMRIRARVILAYESAEREEALERRRAWLTFVVVGAGPTGVELAGALAELARHTLARDFRRVDPRATKILLLEAAGEVLPAFPADLALKARRQLERLGVTVRTRARVTAIDAEGVAIDGERVAARTVIWSAGVRATSITASLGAPLDALGRVRVEPTLALPGEPRVYVIGDAALLESGGRAVPPLAPAAIQEGRHAARNVARALRGEAPLAFRYRDRGALATIGRAAAVADLGRFRCSGLMAWVLWLFVHIFFLIGFRNRLAVLFEWAWAWLTYQRVARVIPHAAERMKRR